MRTSIFLLSTMLWAQSDTKPIVVQIEAPAAKAPDPIALPPMADFLKANAILQAPVTLPNIPPPPAIQSAPAAQSSPLARAPKTYKPAADISLDANAQKALKISQDFMQRPNDPVQGRDGVVLYTYGAGLPTIVCAPGHLCTVELEPGEAVNDKQLSDEERWDLLFSSIGKDPDTRSLVMVRPHDPGLDANLVLATSRRVYYLRLISKPHDYMARVSFQYPGATANVSWTEYKQQQTEHEEKKQEKQEVAARPNFTCEPNSGYSFKGPHVYWRPLSACDDGKSTTYITLPDIVRTMGGPVFMIREKKGDKGLKPASYDVHDTTYVVYRLFYKGALIIGTGKNKREIEVVSPRAN